MPDVFASPRPATAALHAACQAPFTSRNVSQLTASTDLRVRLRAGRRRTRMFCRFQRLTFCKGENRVPARCASQAPEMRFVSYCCGLVVDRSAEVDFLPLSRSFTMLRCSFNVGR